MSRVLGLAADARYAYAISKISEQGELWTLETDAEWVISNGSDGMASIPIWPHHRFARRETVAWTGAEPVCVPLKDDWLSERRAAWFEHSKLRVSVFPVGASSKTVEFSTVAELIRERRERYLRGRRSSGAVGHAKRVTRPWDDLVNYVSDAEIQLVVERVPIEFRTRLREVFRYRQSDAKILGAVSARGRRDIDLATRLPLRVSLRGYLHGGQSPEEFGAPGLGQWPPWAVRRFLLYDVLLHEIGHLQVIDAKASRVKRRFASETKAQEFADELRRTLYSDRFEHRDPIHNAPAPGELSMLSVWNRFDKGLRAQLVRFVLSPRQLDNAAVSLFEPMTAEQRQFLSQVLRSREQLSSHTGVSAS